MTLEVDSDFPLEKDKVINIGKLDEELEAAKEKLKKHGVWDDVEDPEYDDIVESSGLPYRKGRQRNCYYNHGEKSIPRNIADIGIGLYMNSDKPVTSIVRVMNQRLHHAKCDPIEIIDFYFLLVSKIEERSGDTGACVIKSRAPRLDGKGELSIDEFNTFFLAWKSGMSSKECARSIGRTSTIYTYTNIFAPLNMRDKKLRGVVDSNMHLMNASTDQLNQANIKKIFSIAERRIIGGRLAFVLFADKFSGELQQLLFDAVPILRYSMEHTNTTGQVLSEEEARHANKRKTCPVEKPEVDKKRPVMPKRKNNTLNTASRLEKEGNPSGSFRVSDMEDRPAFGDF